MFIVRRHSNAIFWSQISGSGYRIECWGENVEKVMIIEKAHEG